MDVVSQQTALGSEALADRESARFFVSARHGDLECLSATFRTHVYAPHLHETFAMGVILAGCEAWNHRGVRRYCGPGDFALCNPYDVHDGEPLTGGYSYRMSYPSVALVAEAAADMAGRPVTPYFASPVVRDPEAMALFTSAHRRLDEGGDALGADEALLRTLALLVGRHGGLRPLALGREQGPVARARAVIDERYDEDLSLDLLAREAGTPRHLLIRAFRRETGATPHAYLVNRRALAARTLLRAGQLPSEAALAVGFFDQSHLTRAFKARFGVTPGAYRVAFHR
jgi:AraC-like DNA-binding protein